MKTLTEKIVIIFAFVLTFAAGVLTGAIIVREFAQPPRPRAAWWRGGERHQPPPLEILQQRLELNEMQRQKVATILEKHREQIRQHIRQVQPPMQKLLREMVAEIDSVLTPEQREKFHREFPRFWRMPPWPQEEPPGPPIEMP